MGPHPEQLSINERASDSESRFGLICLVAGQTLHALSTFYWLDSGRHSVNGSVLIILAMVFWAAGFPALFDRVKNRWYRSIGLLYAIYGCVGGIAFGFEGLYSAIFNVSEKMGVDAYALYPLQMNLVLFWAGPAFPLSLMILGIVFLVQHTRPWWVSALIIIGAILFPVSRILRIEMVAHVADLTLLLPLGILAVTHDSAQGETHENATAVGK